MGGDEDEVVAQEDSLERAVLREDAIYSAADVAEQSGITLDEARRLWRALGFPEHGAERAFTRSDVAAVATLVGAVDAGLFDFDIAVNLTRGVGQTMARLADWEVGALVHRVEEIEASEHGTGDTVTTAMRMIEDLSEPFERLMIYAWRRHLAAAVVRMEAMSAGEDDLHTTRVTVGFADIVSFTALSNEISREKVGDLVELFESRCADVIATQRGRVIKSLGDSVLFVNDDPLRAYETAEGIIKVIGRDARMPDVHVGMATGHVVTRMGDVFGPPVNLASRLTNIARRNRIILDQATADLLPAREFESRRLPARPVRGFGLLEPVTVRRT